VAALETGIHYVGGERMSTLLGAVSAIPGTAVKLCTCGHDELQHDAIARRYCAATSSAELIRGCICREASFGPH
jgi:hypothetical protein